MPHLRKLPQLVQPKCLGEDVGNLPISLNEAQGDFTVKDKLAHEMVMHFYVLYASMEYEVLGELDVVEIVTIDGIGSTTFTWRSLNSLFNQIVTDR